MQQKNPGNEPWQLYKVDSDSTMVSQEERLEHLNLIFKDLGARFFKTVGYRTNSVHGGQVAA